MLQEIVQHLGYSEKESKIYIALLELGISPTSTIARFIGENRITTYSALKVLVKKGLVLETKKDNIQLYSGLEPNILIEQERLKYENLQDSLPDFLSLVNNHVIKPKVVFYEGINGLKNLMRCVIKDFEVNPKMELFGFLGAKTMNTDFKNFLKESLIDKKQKPKEAPTHVIIVGNQHYWYADYCREKYFTKTVEELSFPMEHEIFTYESKVIILMYQSEELSGIIIESQSLANGIRSMFELVWKYAPDINKNRVL